MWKMYIYGINCLAIGQTKVRRLGNAPATY